MDSVSSNKRKPWLSYLAIIVGTGIMGLAIKCIFDPISLVTGGFTGVAILIKKVSGTAINGGIPLWLTNLVLNIPVFLVALRIKGKRFIGRTAVATVLLSTWLYVIPQMDIVNGDFTLAAIFGGVLTGVGLGMILWANATTGGTDMVAALIQHKLRHYSIAQILQMLDGIIVLLGLYVFGLQPTLYASVAIFIVSKVTDTMLEGMKFSKAAYIITEQYEEVAKKIMSELDRGVTGLEARGMYSGDKKCMLYCVVSKKEIVILKELITDIDKNAFVIVGDVREVLGEGFIEYR
ncbi:MAG: YitT family protein [Lachnospiraceae bacterium]